MSRLTPILITLLLITLPAITQDFEITAEESVYTITSPNNGSGPFWSQGCSSIARMGDDVYIVQMETGEGIPRLCNTRWKLLKRDAETSTWNAIAQAPEFRQREPVSLAVTEGTSLYLNVNDSLTAPGMEYKECLPNLLRIMPNTSIPSVSAIHPVWNTQPYFTDHSYRGFSADGQAHTLLMLNIDAKTSLEHYALLDRYGVTLANGAIEFPIRSCYPYVALEGNAAYVLAISDIVEPVKAWRTFKFEQTQRKWDYVFRISYFTWTPDLSTTPFEEPIEIVNVDDTAGHISNQDLWIAPDGTAYILYSVREVQSAMMRDKFFPDKSILNDLYLAKIKDGKVIARHCIMKGTEKTQPGRAQLQELPNGRVLALLHVSGENGGNKLLQIYPELDSPDFISVPFESPFTTFTLAAKRSGNQPANTIDILGHQQSGGEVAYGQLTIK